MTEQTQQNPTTFGKYQILEELGRGGFGIVYKATDSILGRLVALKVLHPELLVNRAFLDRFRQEARISAQLDHPNLVPVHEFSENEGRYYIAMGYMAGGSLKELLQKQGKLEPQAAYELLEQVVAALSYAHSKDIIHRDLKPGNILLDENGKARVADMGFAKVMSEGASRSMSASGSLIGTPAYMAPEVWRNKPAQPQTDIYSLGCILYEMLTGKVLFEGDSPAEVMTRHVVDGPEYAPELPEEMRIILDKALKREPSERYPDAKDFLADLKAVLRADVPLVPKPKADSKVEKPTKPVVQETKLEDRNQAEIPSSRKEEPDIKPQSKVSRKTLVVGVVGLVAIVGFIIIIMWFSSILKKVALPEPSATPQATEAVFAMVEREPTITTVAEAAASPTGPSTIRATSTGLPTATSMPTQASKPGSTMITASNADQVEQLMRIGKGAIEQVIFSPDGSQLAVASSMGIYIYDCVTMEEVAHFANDIYIYSLAWSPDGKKLASGIRSSSIILWAADSGARLSTLEGHSDTVRSINWSPDGKRLASGSGDDTIILWDIESDSQLRTLKGHTSSVNSVAWSPDGDRLASGSDDGTIILWDADSGEIIRTLNGRSSWIFSVAWSPDGSRVATGNSDSTISVWSTYSGVGLLTLEGHTDMVDSVAWSPNGKTLASGSHDNTTILWDVGSGARLRTLEGHTRSVDSVAWSLDGKQLVTGSDDNTIILWNADTGARLSTIEGHTDVVASIAWSPDGTQLASGSYDTNIMLWDINSGESLHTLKGHTYGVSSVAWSPEGKCLASGSADTNIILWDVNSGEKLRTLWGHYSGVSSVAWSPDGYWLASGTSDNNITRWSLSFGSENTMEGHTDAVNSVAWSPDGRQLASGADDYTIILWNTSTDTKLLTFEGHTDIVTSVTWSPDGKYLASGSDDDTIILWDVGNGERLNTLNGHGGNVNSIAWSPDGSMVASASVDGSVIIWDSYSGEKLCRLESPYSMTSVVWSPDGKTLASAGWDGTIRFWGIP